jgi:peptidoglycan hydrolase-like protein with peptidoglycan-binding domain
MLPPIVKQLPPATQKRFDDAYTDKKRPLAWGEHDDVAVGLLQAWLAHLGYHLPRSVTIELDEPVYNTDGIFWDETRQAVIDFQKENDLFPDGMVGKLTLDKISERLARIKTNPPLPTRKASVIVTPRPYRCPAGALICPEPPR